MAAYHATAEQIAETHPLLGDAFLWNAGFHVMPALYHHFALLTRRVNRRLRDKS
uniref:hypothetical protein n=1 Tax=Marinobacterium profundum TaxID=1714300 RepID=UPI000B180538|nr:hypothetical protein [Marinobacterium profundum]